MKRYSFISYCVLLLTSLMSLNCWALGVTTYYHDDHLGSPVYASNDFGQVEWQQRYKPYGEKTNNSPSTQKNDIWYTGKPHDDDTGLTYMNARYYDPVVGRFMAIDPVGFVDANIMSFNRYLYVNNNPYKYNDPDGEFLNFVVGGAFAAVQNIAIQNIEIALGVRQSFSYGELAAETALGVVTSGASTVKNGGRLTVTAINYANKADNIGDTTKIANRTSNSIIDSDNGNYVYRGLAKGEDPSVGLNARSPGAGNSEISHVAGKRESQWISTSKSADTASEYGGENGVVRIDLNKVISEISDVSGGFEKGGRMSNWAKKDLEVLIKDYIPPEAITRVR